MADGEGAAARGGLLHSIRRMAGSLIGAAQTRLEILATEIEEERLRLEQLLLIALAAAFCLAFGIALAVALAILYFWDTHRLLTVGLLAAVFLGAGGAFGWVLRAKVKSRPTPFAVTRGELAKDGALLQGPQE